MNQRIYYFTTKDFKTMELYNEQFKASKWVRHGTFVNVPVEP